jgi:hypothetical protein
MMKRLFFVILLCCQSWSAEPFEEDLQYTINWPSGLSLGEGRLKAARNGENWSFEFQFDAAIPGFGVSDRFQSLVNQEQCSIEFDKELRHGRRKSKEKISFDSHGAMTRQTEGGGRSESQVPPCARDALAFVFHLRKELSQGRIPPAQTVYYGAPYQVRLEYKGVEILRLAESVAEADRMAAFIKGPASNFEIDVWFARDAMRTLLIAKVPLAMGTFSMEIVR